jgi:hypothetical protein
MADQRATAEALAIAVSSRVPVMLWGGPGTGKTAIVQSVGARLDQHVETVIASLREPADFAGLPIVGADGMVRLAAPAWAARLASEGQGILFLDGMTTAPPSVQAALLRVVLERVVGELALPGDVSIVAAANPPEQAAGGWDLAAPLANRFCHIDWPVDQNRFIEALLGGWPSPDVPRDDDELRADPGASIRGLLAGFLKSRPALLHAIPGDAANAGRAWPSPRSWDMACALWTAAVQCNASEDARLALISGCVGPGPARELLTWVADADLPDPEDVLADPARFRLPDRGDRQFAVLSAVTAAVVADLTVERWEAAFAIVEQAVQRGAPDVAAIAARTLAEHVPPGVSELPAGVTSLAPVLSRAGILRRRAAR